MLGELHETCLGSQTCRRWKPICSRALRKANRRTTQQRTVPPTTSCSRCTAHLGVLQRQHADLRPIPVRHADTKAGINQLLDCCGRALGTAGGESVRYLTVAGPVGR